MSDKVGFSEASGIIVTEMGELHACGSRHVSNTHDLTNSF